MLFLGWILLVWTTGEADPTAEERETQTGSWTLGTDTSHGGWALVTWDWDPIPPGQ